MVANREARVEELEVIVNLSEGANRRARCANLVLLLDSDRGRNVIDSIDDRLVHPIEELANVGREGLYVAPLPFGIESVKGEGRFTRTGRPRHDSELA